MLKLALNFALPALGIVVADAWSRPLTLFTIFMAMAPLIGVALGWTFSFSKRRRVQQAV